MPSRPEIERAVLQDQVENLSDSIRRMGEACEILQDDLVELVDYPSEVPEANEKKLQELRERYEKLRRCTDAFTESDE